MRILEKDTNVCYCTGMALDQEKFKQDVIAGSMVLAIIVALFAIFGGF